MSNKYRIPIGCAFNADDLFYTFNCNRINVPMNIRKKYISGISNYTPFIVHIFKSIVKYIFKDIVETGATFKLPLAGKMKAYIKIDCEKDECFKNFRKAGKWKNLNFFETLFTAPLMNLHFIINGTDRKKMIFCDTETTDRMVEKCNEGFQYGDKNLDKTINDYYDIAFKMFPDVPQKDIKTILIYGWRMLYLHRVQGGEIAIRIKGFSCLFGVIHKNKVKLVDHYCNVLAAKLRITARKKKFPKTNYYYVAFTTNRYKEFLNTKKIDKEPIYQLYEECFVTEHAKTHIIRIKLPKYRGNKLTLKGYLVNEFELILTRLPATFLDICVTNNDYLILSCKGPKKNHSRSLNNK